jgi:hypothetical protein
MPVTTDEALATCYAIKAALLQFRQQATFLDVDINHHQVNSFTEELNDGIEALELPHSSPMREDKLRLLQVFYSNVKALKTIKDPWVAPTTVRETRKARSRFVADFDVLILALTDLALKHCQALAADEFLAQAFSTYIASMQEQA